jgi:hypothetical protein
MVYHLREPGDCEATPELTSNQVTGEELEKKSKVPEMDP